MGNYEAAVWDGKHGIGGGGTGISFLIVPHVPLGNKVPLLTVCGITVRLLSTKFFFCCSMAPRQVLFDQAGLGRGKVGARWIGKSAAVRGLKSGTSFAEVRAPYLQAMPAGLKFLTT